MEKVKHKIFSLDGDTVEVKFIFDEKGNVWHGDYPDFIGNQRYTPNGRLWVAVTWDDCKHSTSKYGDCGGCEHLMKQDESDLIGVCMNNKLKTVIDNEEANIK